MSDSVHATDILTGEEWLVENRPYTAVSNGTELPAKHRGNEYATLDEAIEAAVAKLASEKWFYLLPRPDGNVLVGPLRENSVYPEETARALWDEWLSYWPGATTEEFWYRQVDYE